jgi:hypothetical protein
MSNYPTPLYFRAMRFLFRLVVLVFLTGLNMSLFAQDFGEIDTSKPNEPELVKPKLESIAAPIVENSIKEPRYTDP